MWEWEIIYAWGEGKGGDALAFVGSGFPLISPLTYLIRRDGCSLVTADVALRVKAIPNSDGSISSRGMFTDERHATRAR